MRLGVFDRRERRTSTRAITMATHMHPIPRMSSHFCLLNVPGRPVSTAGIGAGATAAGTDGTGGCTSEGSGCGGSAIVTATGWDGETALVSGKGLGKTGSTVGVGSTEAIGTDWTSATGRLAFAFAVLEIENEFVAGTVSFGPPPMMIDFIGFGGGVGFSASTGSG